MTFHWVGRVAVEEEGEGPAVVCVHGLGGSSNTWTPLMPALARHRVIRIDLPGRSMRITRCRAIAGRSGVQVLELPPRPCTQTTAGPSPSSSTATRPTQ